MKTKKYTLEELKRLYWDFQTEVNKMRVNYTPEGSSPYPYSGSFNYSWEEDLFTDNSASFIRWLERLERGKL